jgi:transposase
MVMFAAGMREVEIAEARGISRNAVNLHLKKIRRHAAKVLDGTARKGRGPGRKIPKWPRKMQVGRSDCCNDGAE